MFISRIGYPTFILFLVTKALCITGLNNALATDPGENQFIYLSAEDVRDKIRGGLLGEILGNLNGLPHEWQYIDQPGNVTNYVPSLPDGARTDDDTDFEWVYIYEMQQSRNPFLSQQTISDLWQEKINKRIWCSNRYARHLMDLEIIPPYTGYSLLNPWATFNISGQFLSETFGLLAPGMPQTAGKIALNYTTVAIGGEPAQSTQFFTAMIATAFRENDMDKIFEAGLSALDPNSKIIKLFNDIKSWHDKFPDDWRQTRKLLKDTYTQEGGKIRDNNGYELNTGSIIAALLYGKGDFAESLKLAFNFGWDADCNAATVGTILGVTYGYKKMLNPNDPYKQAWNIVDRYKNTTRDNMPMDETITSFADRLIELFELINENKGGGKVFVDNKLMYKIPSEEPQSVKKLISDQQQKQLLISQFKNDIIHNIKKGTKKQRARAVYMAVCLGLNTLLSEKYPEQWNQACSDLSGYWKVMNNIFMVKRPGNDFEALKSLRQKFESAGFKPPKIRFTDQQLYSDMDTWKEPADLY